MKDFVIGSMYWIDPKMSLRELQEDLRKVKENGLSLLRIFVDWEYVEPKMGEWDFSLYDRFFQAAEEEKISVMPTLVFYPPFHWIKELTKQGADDRRRRVPCFDRPEVQKPLAEFIQQIVKRYCSSPVLKIWNVWNEPTDTVCTCPHSLKAFVDWLHEKYHTMEELREAWAGEYYIFNPILPESMEALTPEFLQDVLEYASRERDTALRLDWQEFQQSHSALHLRWMVDQVRKYDATHECHSNFSEKYNEIFTGVNPFLAARELDSVSGSLHPYFTCADLQKDLDFSKFVSIITYIDRFRSWGAGKEAWIGEYQGGSAIHKVNAYTPRGCDHFATLFHALARGLKGIIFWEWQSWRQSFFEIGESSLRNPSDGGPTERSEAVRKFATLYQNHKDFFDQAKMSVPQVAIFTSMDQNSMDYAGNVKQGGLFPWSVLQAHSLSVLLCHRLLAEAGIMSDFVTECQLDDHILARYKVLIVPHLHIVSPKTAAALKKFVAEGGALWTDGRCGFLDEHRYLRDKVPCNGLDELFGCREIDEVAPFPTDRITTEPRGDLPPYRELQRLELYSGAKTIGNCNGYPAAVSNRFGKGCTEYWGTGLCWGDVMNGTHFTESVLLDFIQQSGIEPEVHFSGRGALLSCVHTSNRKALIVTNDSSESLTLRIPQDELPGVVEEWCENLSVLRENGEIICCMKPGMTVCLVSVGSNLAGRAFID